MSNHNAGESTGQAKPPHHNISSLLSNGYLHRKRRAKRTCRSLQWKCIVNCICSSWGSTNYLARSPQWCSILSRCTRRWTATFDCSRRTSWTLDFTTRSPWLCTNACASPGNRQRYSETRRRRQTSRKKMDSAFPWMLSGCQNKIGLSNWLGMHQCSYSGQHSDTILTVRNC